MSVHAPNPSRRRLGGALAAVALALGLGAPAIAAPGVETNDAESASPNVSAEQKAAGAGAVVDAGVVTPLPPTWSPFSDSIIVLPEIAGVEYTVGGDVVENSDEIYGEVEIDGEWTYPLLGTGLTIAAAPSTTVEARPAAGYTFPAGAQKSWTFTPAPLEIRMWVTCEADGTARWHGESNWYIGLSGREYDAKGNGLGAGEYGNFSKGNPISGSFWEGPGYLPIAAEPAPGYAFPDDARRGWEFTYPTTSGRSGSATPTTPSAVGSATPDAIIVTPPAPTQDGGVVVIPTAAGVIYTAFDFDLGDWRPVTGRVAIPETAKAHRIDLDAWVLYSGQSDPYVRNILAGSFSLVDECEPAPSFIDVPVSNLFFTEIEWLAAQGISTGWDTPAGKEFRPLAPVARDAMAAFMYRLAGKPAFTPPTTSPFIDVPTSNMFYKEISWLAAEGISTGWDTSAGKEYRPLQPVARDAMAAFFYRFEDKPAYTPPAVSPFVDVATSNVFYKEIAWMRTTGISSGWPDGTFRPLQPVARDAMAAFMYRLAH